MLWFIMAGMAAFTALAAIWPVLRSSPRTIDADPAASEAAFYKAQLEEIQRDVERGVLPQSEAASARAEAARRLISSRSEAPKPTPPSRNGRRVAAAALIAVGVPVIALPLYAYLGRPQMPDEPLASRPPASLASSDIEAAVAGVEAHLIAKPDDGKGWAVIAPVYMRLERYEDAARAYSEALRLLGEDGARRAAYGEALVAAAGGVVTDNAREAFMKALADEPGLPQARFYLALAAEQDGRKADAIRDYEFAHRRRVAGCAMGRRGQGASRLAERRADATSGPGRLRGRARIAEGDDRGHGQPAREPTRQQRRQRRRMGAPYSRLCGPA